MEQRDMMNQKEEMLKTIIEDYRERKIPKSYEFLKGDLYDLLLASNTEFNINIASAFVEYECKMFSLRDQVINLQGFALVADSWIDPLVKYIQEENLRCIEIMAGLGTITHALTEKGVACIATDIGHRESFTIEANRWSNIIEVDAVQAIKDFKADIYICAWPEMDNSAYDALMAMRKYRPGAIMLYIGEREGGCTANNKFFEDAKFLNYDKFSDILKNYHSFEYIHDEIWFVR